MPHTGIDSCNLTANSTPWAQKDKASGDTSKKHKHGQARIFEEFLELKNEAKLQAVLSAVYCAVASCYAVYCSVAACAAL